MNGRVGFGPGTHREEERKEEGMERRRERPRVRGNQSKEEGDG